nr:MAG TPA: hypothetical protein [Caudoviricetes sp.]
MSYLRYFLSYLQNLNSTKFRNFEMIISGFRNIKGYFANSACPEIFSQIFNRSIF